MVPGLVDGNAHRKQKGGRQGIRRQDYPLECVQGGEKGNFSPREEEKYRDSSKRQCDQCPEEGSDIKAGIKIFYETEAGPVRSSGVGGGETIFREPALGGAQRQEHGQEGPRVKTPGPILDVMPVRRRFQV